MKQNKNKSTNYKISFIIIVILSLTLHQNSLLAKDIDTIIVSDPATLNIIDPALVVYSPQSEGKYAIAMWDPDTPQYSFNIYKIYGDTNTIFASESYVIDNLTFLGNDLYCTIEGIIKGYDTETKDLIFQMDSPIPTLNFWGLAGIGDSIILAADSEWDCILRINVNTRAVSEIEVNVVIRNICYDSYNNRIIVFHKYSANVGLKAVDLNNNNEISNIEANITSDSYPLGIITDKRGNIFLTFWNKPGVYLVDTIENDLVEVTDQPVKPGLLYYVEEDDCLLVPDMTTSELYTIWLTSDIPNSISTKEFKYDEISNYKVFPNPSDGIVNISFDLTRPVKGKINIYSIDGKLVKNFPEQYWHKGKNLLIWNGEKLKAGIYQVQISGLKYKNFQKLVIIK